MKVQKEKSQGELTFTIVIEADEIQKARKDVARKLSRELRIPGFRPGKAPYQVVVRYLGGEQALLETVVEEYLPTWLEEALKPHFDEIDDLDLMDRPEIKGLEEGAQEITITLRVPAKPTVELGPLPSLSDVDVEAIPEEEVEKSVREILEELREEQATWIPTSGPAEYGDLATVNLEGRLLTGETVLDLKEYEVRIPSEEPDEEAPSQVLVAGQESQPLSPDRFWEPFRGMRVGETREFSVAYPEDWPHEPFAGRTVLYRVTLLDLKKPVLPALDDELAQLVSDFETLDELRQKIREDVVAQAEEQRKERLKLALLDKLVEASRFEISPRLIDHKVQEELERIENLLRAQGLSLDAYLAKEGKTREEYVAELRQEIETDIKRAAVISAYGKEHNVSVRVQEGIAYLLTRNIPPTTDRELNEAMLLNAVETVFLRKTLNKLLADVTGEPEEVLPETKMAEEIVQAAQKAEEEESTPQEKQEGGQLAESAEVAEPVETSTPPSATSAEEESQTAQ